MRFKYSILLCSIITYLLAGCSQKEANWELISPDGTIMFKIQLDPSNNGIQYEALHGNSVAIETSSLGIEMENQDFSENLRYISKTTEKINEKYSTITGKRINDVNHCNELSLLFENDASQQMEVIFRAYNDGIAFRYHFPGSSKEEKTIVNELSSFNIPQKGGKAWMQKYDTLDHWSLGYEIAYDVKIPIGTSADVSYGWAFPLLFETADNLWMLVSEADLDENYCAMHIQKDAPAGEYKMEFPGEYECYGKFSRYPKSTLPWTTPWRFVIIGDNLGTLVESNLVNHLSRPTQFENTNWIEPGVCSWSWWYDHLSSSNYIPLKDHVDLSKEMGWKYSLVDADWDIMINGNIDQLIEYADKQDVELFLWYNSGGPNNRVMWRMVMYPDSVQSLLKNGVPQAELNKLDPIIDQEFFREHRYKTKLKELLGEESYKEYGEQVLLASRFNNAQPRDRFYEEEARVKEFKMLADRGVRGIKIDFFMSDKQEIIKLYLNIFKEAAKNNILVNTHGSTMPRGWSKTYPNLLTMESVMGAEMYGGAAWPELALTQNTIYPFLRNVVGPMDYTPTTFSDKANGHPHITSYAHELALSVMYETGLLHIAEGAPELRKMPEEVLDFLKNVPVAWDYIHFIDGYPGEHCVLARKNGNKYYISGINGLKTEKNVSFNTDFLEKGSYKATYYLDGDGSRNFVFENKTISAGDIIEINMMPAGGFVIVFVPNCKKHPTK